MTFIYNRIPLKVFPNCERTMDPKNLRTLGMLEAFLILEKKIDSPEPTLETRTLENVLKVWISKSVQRQ